MTAHAINMETTAPIKYAEVSGIIDEAAAQFWLVFSNSFPELTSGDSQMVDEDKAALGEWFINDSGEDNAVVAPWEKFNSVHASFTESRIKNCISEGAQAALRFWTDAGMPAPKETKLPESVAFQLEAVVRHVLWANNPYES